LAYNFQLPTQKLVKIAHYIKEVLKTLAGVVIILLFLKLTGLLGSVSFITQSAVLKTGLMNASVEEMITDEDFNYDFTIKDLSDNRVNFDRYKGKVIFINLWATWCSPCRAEMPGIQKLYEKADPDKVSFVLLSVDKDLNKDKVVKFIKDRSFTFPTFMPSGRLSNQLNVPNIPTTLIISKTGKIVVKEIGMKNYDTPKFKKLLDKLASE
jgi:thiol-disulfide isomerase/thioredoxin